MVKGTGTPDVFTYIFAGCYRIETRTTKGARWARAAVELLEKEGSLRVQVVGGKWTEKQKPTEKETAA